MKILRWIFLVTAATVPVALYLLFVFGFDVTQHGTAAHIGFWLTLCWFASMIHLANKYPPPVPWRTKKPTATLCAGCGQQVPAWLAGEKAELSALQVGEGDVLVVRGASDEMLCHLKDAAWRLPIDRLLIFVGDGTSIENLNDEQMRRYGWVREVAHGTGGY